MNKAAVFLLALGVGGLNAAHSTAGEIEEDTGTAVASGSQTEPEPRGLLPFEHEVVVTATHLEVAPIESVASDELREASASDLAEVLRRRPGLAAFRRGPINLDPVVRGLVESQVGVYVDGTRTFAAGPARMDSGLSHVSPALVQGVQVVKGPYALSWGAGLAGLRARTHRTPFAAEGTRSEGVVGVRYGGNASRAEGHARFGSAGERWRFSLATDSRTGDDYEAGDGSTVPGDYESAEARWVLGLRSARGSTLEYSGGYQAQDDVDYPGRILDATYFRTRSHALSFTRTLAGEALDGIEVLAYVNRKDHLMNNDEKPTARPNPNRIPPFGLRVDLPTESNTAGGRVRLSGRQGNSSWLVGADGYRVEQTAVRRISRRDLGVRIFEDIVWPDAEIEDLGVYGQSTWSRGDWVASATVRVDRVSASAGRTSEFFGANTTGDLDQSETNVGAAISARRAVSNSWSVVVGLGRATRTASALERYSDRFPSSKFQVAAEFLGDPDLDPESAWQADLGADFAAGSLRASIEAYYRVIDDYITVRPDPSIPRRLPLSPPLVFRYANGDRATFYGLDARVTGSVGERLSWRSSLAALRGEDETFDEPAFGIAPATLSAGLRALPTSRGNWWVDAQVTVVDDQDRVAEARLEVPTPGYTVVDLSAAVELARWTLRLGVENVTDEAYASHLNSFDPFARERVLEMGRNLYFGVEVGL